MKDFKRSRWWWAPPIFCFAGAGFALLEQIQAAAITLAVGVLIAMLIRNRIRSKKWRIAILVTTILMVVASIIKWNPIWISILGVVMVLASQYGRDDDPPMRPERLFEQPAEAQPVASR